MYRILHAPHQHTGDKWCIYPSYDYTHCLNDSLENITHSLCSLEFEVRRESYNWLVDSLSLYRPPQIEFSRLNVDYTVLSKRKIIKLIEGGYVRGWDDPRLMTLNGLRRRGYTPAAINDLCERVGVTRSYNLIKLELLEHCLRVDLDDKAPRAMAVLNPLRVTITNYPDKVEKLEVPNIPAKPEKGSHSIPFSKVIYIDRNDFRLHDSKDYYGLAPGKEVGLKYAHNITCTKVVQNDKADVIELEATYDPVHKNKPKGHLHWVAEPIVGQKPLVIEVRLYDRLFTVEKPLDDFLHHINPKSLEIIPETYVDPSVAYVKPFDKVQFERVGIFSVDPDSTPAKLVFNKAVALKDNYNKKKT